MVKADDPLTVSVSPGSLTMDVGQSEVFTADPLGGSGVYQSFQWYLGGLPQAGQSSTFMYSAASMGSPSITVTVTDSSNMTSNPSAAPSVTVNSALSVPSVSASVGLDQTPVSASFGYWSFRWYRSIQLSMGGGGSRRRQLLLYRRCGFVYEQFCDFCF